MDEPARLGQRGIKQLPDGARVRGPVPRILDETPLAERQHGAFDRRSQ
jgi:hypothetical protein